jgi:hypothetical protein
MASYLSFNHPLPFYGREQGDATVFTKQKRKKAELGTSSGTPTGTEGTNTYRTTARIVGAMYLAGFVVGITGIVLIQSILGAPDHLATLPVNSMLLAIGAVLWLMAVAWDAAHGVLMFPVLKQHNERIALGYLGFRIMDALFIAIMVLFVLIQIPIGSEYVNAGASDASYLQALSTVFIGVWLIVKGFNPSAFASETANFGDGVLTGVRQPTVVPSNG